MNSDMYHSLYLIYLFDRGFFVVVYAAGKHLPCVISFRLYGHVFNSIQIYL